MKEITELHQLKALPLLVCVRIKDGNFRSRNENGHWSQMGSEHAVVWDEEKDLPGTAVWTYAEQIGDPSTEALAQLANAILQQQMRQQLVEQARQEQISQQFAPGADGQPPQPPQAPGAAFQPPQHVMMANGQPVPVGPEPPPVQAPPAPPVQ